MANTIKLKDYAHVVEEAPASAAITPGNFVTQAADGTVARSAADYQGVQMVASEDEFQGKTITDDYAADDQVQLWIPQSGDQVNAIAAAAIAKGAIVELAAAGQVQTLAAGSAIGEALEAAAAQGDHVAIRMK